MQDSVLVPVMVGAHCSAQEAGQGGCKSAAVGHHDLRPFVLEEEMVELA